MTESEILTKNPQSNIHAPHQHSQQQLQQPSTSLLLNTNVRLDSRPETLATTNLINTLESNYQIVVERFGSSSLNEAIQFLTSNIIDSKEAKHLIDGFFCGVLVDPRNAEKHFTCLKTIAISTEQWTGILTSFNMLILELFHFMKSHCKQQLLYFIDEALKLQKTNLDSSITNICRALSDGTDFKETCQIVHQFAQRLLASHNKFVSFPRNSTFPPTAFALFSRFISDAQLVANAGVMNPDSFKQPLVEFCLILVRERFNDLLQLGHDLFLLFLRLSRVSQFVPIWRTLLHNPSTLVPKVTGLQQLLTIPTSTSLLNHRVSLRISRKMADILKTYMRLSSLGNSNLPSAKQLQADLNKQFEALKQMHLSGPDSGSIRAEIIRHVWAFTEPKDFNLPSIEARANLLGWLLRCAKPGAEQQWCKLAFFWEWFGFDPLSPSAASSAEPIISTIRHLLQNGHLLLGNSLVDFLIKSTTVLYPPLNFFFVNSVTSALKTLENYNFLQVHTTFANPKLDQILRDQFRTTFFDFFPKRVTSIADNLADPTSIIDFGAIRQTTTNSSIPSKQQQNLPEIVPEILSKNLEKSQQEKGSGFINGKGGVNVVSSTTTSTANSSCPVSSKSQQNLVENVPETSKSLEKPKLETCNFLNGTSMEDYKNVCEEMDVEWEKQLAKDLEQCSFDDYQLFSHNLVNVLSRLTPLGLPTKVMRLICGSINPQLLSRLMSEIVRENIVLFGEGNVLNMLIDSLKWDSLEQIMLWQLLQTEAVEFDKFIDLLQRLNYSQHPEATAAIIVIMRNMEPDPEISVMRNLIRNLLLRPPDKDLFTVDAIKLLIDYDENIPPVATCISKFVKQTITSGEINAATTTTQSSGSPTTHGNKIKKKNNRALTAEYIFGHLDNLRKHCIGKDSNRVENLFKNPLLLDMITTMKRNPKIGELRSKFDELFGLFDNLLEDEQAAAAINSHGGKLRRKANNNNIKKQNREGGNTPPPKRKRKIIKESESDDDY